ncbi:hypothetical protein C8F04DRAFT_1012626 [Mycena alexandri]|uniref:F-box domain-containing protein n=1 Tax=Mycena alexandri TaxID=1745969 RepID=A0AAD6S6Q4_9AGAR|nr:hypothetical protein C8F04DRAFT_1012626 [Mycena alexandri]
MAPPSLSFPPAPTPPPGLTRLVECNLAPSTLESNMVTAYTDEVEAQIALVDRATAFLSQRRADLEESLKTAQAIRSPMRRLPPEILGEIFTFAGLDAGFLTFDSAPWLLTRICRHWSAVCLATPKLWSTLVLNLDGPEPPGMVALTKLHLQRSANVPLSVQFSEEDGVKSSSPILEAIISHSDRWRIADVYLTLPLLNQITSIRGRLSSLTQFMVSVDYAASDSVELDAEFWNILTIAPNLQFLRAHSWDMRTMRPTPFTVAWNRLTRLSTTFASNTEALSILRQLSDIVECKFAFTMTDPLQMDSPVIRLPHLRFLGLQIQDPQDAQVGRPGSMYSSMLDFLVTPCLQSLATDDTADESAVLGLIDRSDCATSLTTFRFQSTLLIDRDLLLRLIAKMTQLTSLDISDLPRSSPFIRTLASRWVGRRPHDRPSRLTVRITDRGYVPNRGMSELVKMRKDALFLEIKRDSYFADIVLEPLEERPYS